MLAEPFVRRGDHGDLGDAGELGKQLFDLRCADVLAAADDDVLLAVGDGEVAAPAAPAAVFCVVPTVVVERVQRRVDIAGEAVRSAAQDLTVLRELDLDTGQWPAVGAEPLLERVCMSAA